MSSREPPKAPGAAGEAARVGLCFGCRWSKRIVSLKGSSFWLCERFHQEPARFPKYPPLPVWRCAGYEPRPGS